MLKNISNLGSILNESEQKTIKGGLQDPIRWRTCVCDGVVRGPVKDMDECQMICDWYAAGLE